MKCSGSPVDPMLIRSPPVWGAWIEIGFGRRGKGGGEVAPRMGGVD